MSKHEIFTVRDKYATSLDSYNLKVDCDNHQADAIIAVALSDTAGIGSLLWRAKYHNDSTVYFRLLEQWTLIVIKKSIKENWNVKEKAKEIARISLQYWLNDVCEACKGTAKAPHPANAQVLSDDPCVTCNGTAKRPISGFRAQIEYISNCVEMLETEEKTLGSRAMQKLCRAFQL